MCWGWRHMSVTIPGLFPLVLRSIHIVVQCISSVLGSNDFFVWCEHVSFFLHWWTFYTNDNASNVPFFFLDIVFSFFLEIYESRVTYVLFMVTQYLAFWEIFSKEVVLVRGSATVTEHPDQRHGGAEGSYQLPSYNPASRKERAGTQGRNLEAGTNVEAVEKFFLLARSACFLTQLWTTCPQCIRPTYVNH